MIRIFWHILYRIQKTKEITFNNSDVDKYSNGTYQYYEDGKRKTARIANDAEVIYNGKRVTDLSAFKDASYMYFPRNERRFRTMEQ